MNQLDDMSSCHTVDISHHAGVHFWKNIPTFILAFGWSNYWIKFSQRISKIASRAEVFPSTTFIQI